MNLFWVALTITTIAITHISYGRATSKTQCNHIEKQSLLHFKSSLEDPSNRLASWAVGEDCCNWAGVVCHNLTGHVLELHLGGNATYPILKDDDDYDYKYDDEVSAYERSSLGGKISISLLDLRHLRHLDLSNNDFGVSGIPEFFGSMQSLRLLNLSSSGFGGMVPPQLGNLSALTHLDLSDINLGQELTHLFEKDLKSSFGGLQYLSASRCRLSGPIPKSIESLTSLTYLDLSGNQLNGVIPASAGKLFRLEYLDLGNNYLQGTIL